RIGVARRAAHRKRDERSEAIGREAPEPQRRDHGALPVTHRRLHPRERALTGHAASCYAVALVPWGHEDAAALEDRGELPQELRRHVAGAILGAWRPDDPPVARDEVEDRDLLQRGKGRDLGLERALAVVPASRAALQQEGERGRLAL